MYEPTPETVGVCPNCGELAEAVEAVQLPADADGDCVVEAEAGDHYTLDMHPRHRPDVLILDH